MNTKLIISENISMEIVSNPSFYGTFQKQWVMNAQGAELEQMLKDFLTELDEYMQVAGDNDDEQMADEFQNDYHIIEKLYVKVKNKEQLSLSQRNTIRSAMKHNVKSIMTYFC